MRWWLRTTAGGRLLVGSGGVLLGRAPDSDVILSDERASRRHALIHVAQDSLRIVALGQGRTEVSGTTVARERNLEPEEVVCVPGLELTVEADEETATEAIGEWVLQQIGGGIYGVSQSPYTVGGPDDALSFEGWNPKTLTFWKTDHDVSLEAGATIVVDGEEVTAGLIIRCRSGTTIDVGDTRLQVLTAPDESGLASTAADDGTAFDNLPSSVRLSFLPRGARLYVTDARSERTVYLPERRAELLSLLLSPPDPYRAGELVPDDIVLDRLWPRQTKTTNDIHVLVHRVRKSLVSAGIDGATLVEREPRAAGTRFVVRPDTQVVVD